MLQQAAGPGRRFRTAPLEHPFGRGVNLQIRVSDVDALYAAVRRTDLAVPVPLEERWYRHDHVELGNRSEEHTSELQSLMRISYAVFCLKKKKQTTTRSTYT